MDNVLNHFVQIIVQSLKNKPSFPIYRGKYPYGILNRQIHIDSLFFLCLLIK
jgi:hypothetical protein